MSKNKLGTYIQKLMTVILDKEEEQFNRTLKMATALMNKIVRDAKEAGESELSGDQIFRLYDTYGLPIEMAEDIAADNELAIDKEGFEKSLQAQQERGRGAQGFSQPSRTLWSENDLKIWSHGCNSYCICCKYRKKIRTV